jgi:hypothetical protein
VAETALAATLPAMVGVGSKKVVLEWLDEAGEWPIHRFWIMVRA